MATVKIVLRKKKKKDGTFPLALRIIKNRKPSFIHLEYSVYEKDWDEEASRVKKSHPNSGRLNNFLIKKLAEASDVSLETETNTRVVSSQAIKQKIKPLAGATFSGQADLYLTTLKKTGKYNRWNADKSPVKHFKEFLPGNDVALSEITIGLLERFKVHLKATRNVSERTVMNNLVVIRSVFSQAIKQNAVDEKYYPFGRRKIVIKFPETTKVGITKKDVASLENVKLPDPKHDLARDIWLLSFYFAGMRISDVLRLRWSDFQDMRLHYLMGKNKKAGSLKTPEKALRILEKYEHTKLHEDDFVFPDLKNLKKPDDDFEVQHRIAISNHTYDKFLRKNVAKAAGIKAKLTMHISRHTFATLAGDKIPIQMLQKLYRHSDIKTTVGYQVNFIHKDADEALDAVLGS